jgi:hypothetical protein
MTNKTDGPRSKAPDGAGRWPASKGADKPNMPDMPDMSDMPEIPDKPVKSNKTQISLQMDNALLGRLDALASKFGVSRIGLINLSIHQLLEKGIFLNGE